MSKYVLFQLTYVFLSSLNTDNEPPVVTSPNTIPSVFVATGVTAASVTWPTSPSANDIVDGVIDPTTIVCKDTAGNVVMSGDSFPVGTTTVTCRANDIALNEGSSQFDITVEGR